jgi:hypothetical protein
MSGGYIPLRFSSLVFCLRKNWLDQKNVTTISDDHIVLIDLALTGLLAQLGCCWRDSSDEVEIP